jgi:hypothetical protein
MIHNVGPLWLAAMWLASVRWVQLDARARLRNPSGVRAAVVAAAMLPFLGTALWACVRPAETLLERRERRLARLLLEAELRESAEAADELARRRAVRLRAEPAADAVAAAR